MILCIETATFSGSVAIINSLGDVIFHELLGEGEKHVAALPRAIKKAGKVIQEVELIAVSIGPGSYTGLRIGLSLAKGLAAALGRPIIGINTLAVLASAAIEKHKSFKVISVLDARRDEVYAQVFSSSGDSLKDAQPEILNEKSWTAEKDEKIVVVGNAVGKVQDLIGYRPLWIFDDEIQLDARHMTAIALRRMQRKEFDNLLDLQPNYLKEYKVGKPSEKIRKILLG